MLQASELVGVSSLLPLCESGGLTSGTQVCWQVTLPIEKG